MPDEIVRERVRHPVGGVERTKQADAAASDVNAIMARWIAHGTVPVTGQRPRYGDFAAGVDYHAAMNAVRSAEADFESLPAAVRAVAENDVGRFLELADTPEGLEALKAAGMPEDRAPDDGPGAAEASEVPEASAEVPSPS